MALRSVCIRVLYYGNADGQIGAFDSGMVVLAMLTLSLFHPGVLLRGPDDLKALNKKVRYKESQSFMMPP